MPDTASFLVDSHGRRFEYLRLSVTEACNFRCTYCLPNGYLKPAGLPQALTAGEIRNLVAGFARMGFWKVRLTGGEPTTRNDIVELVETVARTPGIRKVGLTTNGYRLRKIARELRMAGLSALNISIDSLDAGRFEAITGQPRLSEVLEGLEAALSAGIPSIKVNAVLLRDQNERDLEGFLEFVRERPVSVRFIELMRTGQNEQYFRRHHLSAGAIQFLLARSGWQPLEKDPGAGPALEYARPGYRGRIGVIAPYSKDFCESCNRLRVSSQGGIRLCLFGERDFSLRPLLQDASQLEELVQTVHHLIVRKAESHLLQEGNYGNTWNLSAIGG
ncbi:MAG: GTP 3',8-cyclase MoaA [Oligoflexia bacterium]|nr:GTP 3',8-cyclase MoaA [Oligoflexia bacterium]